MRRRPISSTKDGNFDLKFLKSEIVANSCFRRFRISDLHSTVRMSSISSSSMFASRFDTSVRWQRQRSVNWTQANRAIYIVCNTGAILCPAVSAAFLLVGEDVGLIEIVSGQSMRFSSRVATYHTALIHPCSELAFLLG